MKWTPESIDAAEACLLRIKEAWAKQAALIKRLEFQLALAKQGIDPAEVSTVGRAVAGRDYPFWQKQRFEGKVAGRVRLKDGTEVRLKPPVPFDFEE